MFVMSWIRSHSFHELYSFKILHFRLRTVIKTLKATWSSARQRCITAGLYIKHKTMLRFRYNDEISNIQNLHSQFHNMFIFKYSIIIKVNENASFYSNVDKTAF